MKGISVSIYVKMFMISNECKYELEKKKSTSDIYKSRSQSKFKQVDNNY